MFPILLFSAMFGLQTDIIEKKLSLAEAFEKALTKNERILQAKEEIPMQLGLAKQSLSFVLPTLEGGGRISEQIGFTAGLKIPVLNLSGILGTQSAFKQLRSVEAGYERKQEALLLDVADAYLAVLTQQQILALAKTQHETSEKQLASAMRKAALQEISTLDLKRAQLLAAKTKAVIFNREADFKESLGLLADFLGENSRFELEDFPEVLGLEDQEITVLNARAQHNRLDLKSQKIAVQAAWLGEQSALWMFMPTLQVSTALLLPIDKSHEWKLGLDLLVPFYNGGNRYGLFDSAKAKLRQEKYKKHLLERELSLLIQGALVDIKRRKELYQIQQELVEISQAASKSAENRYSLGQATSLDLLEEQTRLFEAQKDLREAKFFLIRSRLRLGYVLGNPKEVILKDG